MKAGRAFYQVAQGLRRWVAAGIGLIAWHAGAAGVEGCKEIWDGRRWQPVAVAETEEERAAGLSGRPSGGMLFIYPDFDIRWFWMQGMRFDLDIYWLDAQGLVIGSGRMAVCTEEPCEWLASPEPVRYVLELPAGAAVSWLEQRVDWRECVEQA